MAWNTSVAGDVLLPGDGARFGHVTFGNWLADSAFS